MIADRLSFRAVAPGSKSLSLAQLLLGVICAVGGVQVLVYFLSGHHTNGTAWNGFSYAAVLFGAGGFAFIYLSLWGCNVRLLIGESQVGYRDIFGRTRFWSRGQIARAIDMAVSYTKTAQAQRALYLLAADGSRMLVLSTRAWDADDLSAFIEASGAVLDYRDQAVSARQAREQFPRAFGWASEHIVLGTISAMILAIVLVVGGYMLWTALTRA